jgi:hypothetical protein
MFKIVINTIRTLVVCSMLLSIKAFGQPLIPPASNDQAGNMFYVDLNSIERQGYPPATASLTYLANNTAAVGKSRYNCYDTSTSEYWNINSWETTGRGSVNHVLGNFACGVNTADGLWFAIILMNENLEHLYFNGDTLEAVGPLTVDGVKLPNAIKVTLRNGNFNNGDVNFGVPNNAFIDCGPAGDTHFVNTEPGRTMKGYKLAGLNMQYVHFAICGGYFPIRVKSSAPPAQDNPSNSLDKAKDQCEELGFQKGTEKFGECVLTLSK